MPTPNLLEGINDPAEMLELALEQTWKALCSRFDVTGPVPCIESLFHKVDFTRPERAAETIIVNMLLDIMECVGRFSYWYRMPSRAYGLVDVVDKTVGCSHLMLAPEAAGEWACYLAALALAIQKNSGLIQAMLLVDGLMMKASLEDPCVFASCGCLPARTVRVRRSILEKGGIFCDTCCRPFRLVEDFQQWVLEDLKKERDSSLLGRLNQPLTIRHLIEARGKIEREPVRVSMEATVFEALRRMAECNVGAIIVIDEDDEMVGIFTERDYARKIILMGRSSPNTRVMEIMTTEMVTVGFESTLEEGLSLMIRHYIRHLPVMAGERLIGVVSMRDIMAALINQKDIVIETLEKYILGD